ncbi:hypothetical protein V2J09_015671 [Rumex salicifolius]
MATSPLFPSPEKKPWWLSTKKIVDKYVKEAKFLISTRDSDDINSALVLLDSALTLSPRYELALELKARCLLYLRRFRDVADMLQDYIPSYKMSLSSDSDDSSSGSSENSTQLLNRERVKLLHKAVSDSGETLRFKCFSVSDLKKKVLAGLSKNCEKEGQWRYIVLGQACCHLGLMEDAMVLLQTGKRLASAAFRRQSNHQSEDSFSSHIPLPVTDSAADQQLKPPPVTESESINNMIAQIKHLLRRRTSAIAALDAGLYTESIRHFSKIIDGRRPAPQAFLAECYLQRSAACRAAGRIAESIADTNKTLALEPSSVATLIARASLFELIGCLTDSVHDLEHAKLLLNSILRDRKPPGVPAWKSACSATGVPYREIPGRLCQVSAKIQRLKARIAAGETGTVDYHALIGVRRGCSRSELDRSHLLLVLRHKPDRALAFIDRCEFSSEPERDEARDRSRMSAVLLYRLIQKGYSSVTVAIAEDDKAEKERLKAAAALQEAQAHVQAQQQQRQKNEMEAGRAVLNGPGAGNKVYQGVFCRDLAVVGSLLSQARFNRPLSVKYEALSC